MDDAGARLLPSGAIKFQGKEGLRDISVFVVGRR
jgi:hypothetical protein